MSGDVESIVASVVAPDGIDHVTEPVRTECIALIMEAARQAGVSCDEATASRIIAQLELCRSAGDTMAILVDEEFAALHPVLKVVFPHTDDFPSSGSRHRIDQLMLGAGEAFVYLTAENPPSDGVIIVRAEEEFVTPE